MLTFERFIGLLANSSLAKPDQARFSGGLQLLAITKLPPWMITGAPLRITSLSDESHRCSRGASATRPLKADHVYGTRIGDSRLRRIESTSWRDFSETPWI